MIPGLLRRDVLTIRRTRPTLQSPLCCSFSLFSFLPHYLPLLAGMQPNVFLATAQNFLLRDENEKEVSKTARFGKH